jgi:hypothetical protein
VPRRRDGSRPRVKKEWAVGERVAHAGHGVGSCGVRRKWAELVAAGPGSVFPFSFIFLLPFSFAFLI